jgi:hypothetical protein
MTRKLRRRSFRKLRTIGAYIAVPFLALDVFILAVCCYVHVFMSVNRRPDVDWLMMIVILLAGAALGVLLILLRILLASVRYPRLGFMPPKPVLAKTLRVIQIIKPPITPIPYM